MDPATSVGLASSVVQLLTFAGNLLDKSREIYRAADGAVIENQELETIASTIVELSRLVETRVFAAHLPEGSISENESATIDIAIKRLTDDCQKVAKELVEALQQLKLHGDKSAWKSFQLALRCIWSESKINDLASRLGRYRSQIDTLLLVSLRYTLPQLCFRLILTSNLERAFGTLLQKKQLTRLEWPRARAVSSSAKPSNFQVFLQGPKDY
jgi:hypothetical protein